MHMTVLLGTRKCDQSAWRMASNQRFLSLLDREKPWEKSEGLASPASIGTARNTTVIAERHSKAEEKRKLKCGTHNAADSRLRCPEPHFRAIIVQMVYSRPRMGSESKDDFEENRSADETKLFDRRNSSGPSWRSWKFSGFGLIGRRFEPFGVFLCYFCIFFRPLSFCPFRRFFFTDHILAAKSEEQLSIEYLLKKFTTMVAVWAGEFQLSEVRVRKRVGEDGRDRKLRKRPVLNFNSWNFRRKAAWT